MKTKDIFLMTESEKLKAIEEAELRLSLRQDLPFLYGYKHYDWSRAFFESRNHICLLVAANQLGKAQRNESLIPTPSGFKKLGDISVGEFVFSQDGKPTVVTGIPFDGEDEFFRITFNDGSTVEASQNHLWIAKDYKRRFRKTYTKGEKTWDNPSYDKWGVFSTLDIIKSGQYSPLPKSNATKFSIPICEPVNYQEKDLFDPYFVGMYLGNGSADVITFNALDTDLVAYCLKYGVQRKFQKNNGATVVGISRRHDIGLSRELKSFEKEIPEKYLLGSIEQRKLLLAGLIDTDGYVVGGKSCHTSFSTTSEKMSKQFCELINSLGGICQVSKKKSGYRDEDGNYIQCKDSYEITFWTKFNPFKSKRKSEKWKFSDKYKFERVIDKIEKIGKKDCRCISVSAPDSSYLSGREYIVTHNSTANIRKCINWATDQDLWGELWASKPNLFWYLYPSQSVVNAEFETKWKLYLPKGAYKDDSYYGWEEIKKGKDIIGIKFNSGVTLSFKTYEQNVHVLQSSTVYALFIDEELPIELFNELMFRISATDGYFNAVFTATRGQEEWRRAMEPMENEEEWLPDAFKQTVSLYDSMFYEDGTPSPWTLERIKEKEARCSTKSEVLKRIHGKFILDSGGRKYESYDPKRHIKRLHTDSNGNPAPRCPKGWLVFCGVDIGSGGETGHPSAITYVAVKPDMTEGRVIAGWRGDRQVTTAGDVVQKYLELNKLYNLTPVRSFYDWASKDFYNIAVSVGLNFEKAEKSHERGEDIINTLFKNDLMYIYEDEELMKLSKELAVLKKTEDKKKAKDDFSDSFRYALTSIPWNLSSLVKKFEEAPIDPYAGMTEDQIAHSKDQEARRTRSYQEDNGFWEDERDETEAYFEELNDLYE